MAPVALAFAVLGASHRPGDLGIVLASRMVPLLAFLLVGGAAADRFSQRTVLIAANLGTGLTQGAVAIILLTGHYTLGAVAVLEFLNGVLDAFTMPALRGIVPLLVGRDQIQRANSLLGSTRNATKVLGPSVAGLVVVGFGSGPAIAFDAVTFLVAAVFLARMSVRSRVVAQRSTLLADIRTGWSEFRRIRWVWIVTLSACLMNLVQTGTWQILGPTLTLRIAGAETWGFVLSARGVGLLAMSVLMYRLVFRRLLAAGQLASVFAGLPVLALGLRLGPVALVVAAFLAGLGSSVSGISWDTSLQEHVPAGVLSRVSSYDDLLSYIAIPIGQLAVGPATAAFGGFRVCLVAGVLFVVVAALPLASSAVRRLPHRPAAATPTTPTPTTPASVPAA